jgi:hypothetical protein
MSIKTGCTTSHYLKYTVMFDLILFYFNFNFNFNLNFNFSKISSSSQINLSWEAFHTFDMINVDQCRFQWYRFEIEMSCSILLDINSRNWLNIAQKCVNKLENMIKNCLTIFLKLVFLLTFVCTFYFRINVIRLHSLYLIWLFHVSTFLRKKSVKIEILNNVVHQCNRSIVMIKNNIE